MQSPNIAEYMVPSSARRGAKHYVVTQTAVDLYEHPLHIDHLHTQQPSMRPHNNAAKGENMKQQECAKQRHHNNKLGLKRKDRFELVKTLQRTGVPNAQIADITGLTKSTVSTMGKHETYDAYAAECREQSARSLARQAQQPQLTLDTPATTNAEQYAELLADIEHIMQRLEWLEVQIPRRKGLFS